MHWASSRARRYSTYPRSGNSLRRGDTVPERLNMPATTHEQIIDALRPVEDPELRRSIVALGMVRRAALGSDGVADVQIALTVAGCPLRNEITSRVQAALAPL